MADPNVDGEDATIPPTEEERHTETVNDEINPRGKAESELKDDGPDVATRLDALEKELAALKAMMDTLGYGELVTPDNDGDDDGDDDSIENLFD